jgi:hypothetical protein
MKVKNLIFKIAILALLLVTVYIGSSYKLTQGFVDSYYPKFTYKSGSMVLGLSRGIYGITPSVIEEEFGNTISKPVLNFAFDRVQSRYGEVLLNAVKQKIDTTSKNGLYILSISPASFFVSKSMSDTNLDKLDEDRYLDRMTYFNLNPNFEYVRKCFDGSLYRAFIGSPEIIRKSHKDGWIEFKEGFENYTVSKKQIDGWKEENRLGYIKVGDMEVKSEYRISKFKETVLYLQNYGRVVLVRMPLDKDFIELENKHWSNFDTRMNEIANNLDVSLFNYSKTTGDFRTFDGSHLFGTSAIKFTKILCEDIINSQEQFSPE